VVQSTQHSFAPHSVTRRKWQMPDANVWWERSAGSAWTSSSRWANGISSTFSTAGYWITTMAEFT